VKSNGYNKSVMVYHFCVKSNGYNKSVIDVGITLRVTIIALSCTAQLEAHEDT
jgi:hypothetical protein